MTSSPTREEVERMCRCAPFATNEAGIPEMVATLRALLARAEAAERENYELRLLTLGGEDAPGFAMSVSLDDIARLHHEHQTRQQFRIDAAQAEAARLTAEVASLRLTLGGKTFSASVPEPVGCPMPGACATVAEIVRGREVQAAWLRVIQAENTCGVTGKPCDAVRCGCAAEQEMLIREADEARAALAGGGKSND